MPIDGQQQQQQQQHQVYGAQHPPSIKLIKELKANASNIAQTNNLSQINSSIQSNETTVVRQAFKDFEKKTIDAWDIDDDDCFSYQNRNFNIDKFPISIVDSEQVAKKVIKDHKESQEKLSSPKSPLEKQQCSNLNLTKPNGPGKALRYQDIGLTSHKSDLQSENKNKTNLNNHLSTSLQSATLNQSIKENNVIQINSIESKNQAQIQESNVRNNEKNNTLNININMSYLDIQEDLSRCEKFKQILSKNPVNLSDLEKISWKGIPKIFRPICWKLLSDYLPLKKELQEKTIEQKRNSYWESVTECYTPNFLDLNHETLRQILNDIPRMNPLISIFQNEIVQNIFQRVLYVWAVRHPGSGYVQGINDLLTPFFVVFLTEYIEINNYTEIQAKDIEKLSKENLLQLEADCYWCMTKLLDRIQENYVFSQPGIQRKIIALEELIKRIDTFKKNNIEFIQFAFRWMNNLLMREIPLSCTIRLWDTYHAEPFGFSDFHLYVCAAFLSRYSKNLIEEKDFQGLMLLLQSLPTRNFKANDITLLTAEAYKLQVMFANSPNHTLSRITNK